MDGVGGAGGPSPSAMGGRARRKESLGSLESGPSAEPVRRPPASPGEVCLSLSPRPSPFPSRNRLQPTGLQVNVWERMALGAPLYCL